VTTCDQSLFFDRAQAGRNERCGERRMSDLDFSAMNWRSVLPVSATPPICPTVPETASRTGRVYSVNVVAFSERRIVPSMSHRKMRKSVLFMPSEFADDSVAGKRTGSKLARKRSYLSLGRTEYECFHECAVPHLVRILIAPNTRPLVLLHRRSQMALSEMEERDFASA